MVAAVPLEFELAPRCRIDGAVIPDRTTAPRYGHPTQANAITWDGLTSGPNREA